MRILFVKVGAIGDIIQSAVALTEYRARFPGHTIDWVTGTAVRGLAEATGVADRVIAVDEAALIAGSLRARIFALGRSMTMLARKCPWRYDQILTGYQDPRSKILTWGVRAAIHRTLGDRGARPGYILPRNRVHEYWRLLTREDSESIDIAAATAALGQVLLRHARQEAGPEPQGDYIVVAAGGAKNLHRDDALRRWPLDSFKALAMRLLSSGRRVVLVGAASDRWVSDAMSGLDVEDLIGQTTLMQLLNVMQKAKAIVANDSGIFHLATLTGSGLVGLFGPTPSNAVAPMGRARMRILASDNRISCSPCYDGRNFASCKRNICLESITVDAVAQAIAEVSTLVPDTQSGTPDVHEPRPMLSVDGAS